jgi:acetyl-CoA carboxylase biotin carboxyl carrier protein
MDLKLIQRLVRLMERGEVTDLEIDDPESGLRLKLKRGSMSGPASPVVQVLQGGGGVPAPLVQAPAAGAPAAAPSEGTPAAAEAPAGRPVTSPLVGTFYRAPAPGAANFVEVGHRVEIDQVLCIIEAMKVMNEIKADVAGEVLQVLVENGEPVEFGQPLFLIRA